MPPGAAGERPEDPIVDVSFTDAQAFAKWAGKRMPSLQEWEKAARGTDGRFIPGATIRDRRRRANIGNPKASCRSTATPAAPARTARLTCWAMSGNGWKIGGRPARAAVKHFAGISRLRPTAAEPWYVIRGGSFQEPLRDAYLCDFATVPARHHANDIGFRCAKTP